MPTNLVAQRLSNDSGNKRPSSRAKWPKSTHYAPSPGSLSEPAAGSNAAWPTSSAGGTTPSMSADTPVIDLGYRPQSYFWPITHDTHVIAAIKGERRRSEIRNAYDADRVTPLDALYATPTLPDEHRLALGRLHPSFMGGTGSATGSSMSTTATRSRRSAPAARRDSVSYLVEDSRPRLAANGPREGHAGRHDRGRAAPRRGRAARHRRALRARERVPHAAAEIFGGLIFRPDRTIIPP